MLNRLITLTPRALSRAALRFVRRRTVDPFLKNLPDASRLQREWLLRRVRLCEQTQFGRDHGFTEIRDLDDFRARVPVAPYDGFAPYIDAVSRGESEALIPSAEKLIQFTITTGSSGVPKLNPVTDTWLKEYRRGWEIWGLKLFTDHPRYIGSHILQMAGTWDMGRTPGGHQISMVSALLARTTHRMIRPYYAIPLFLNEIPDPVARHYVALRLCILKDIGWIMLMNPGTLIRLAEIGDNNATDLIRDVADGTLTGKFEIPTPIREELQTRFIKKSPSGAKRLNAIADRTGRLLPKDYWRQPVIAGWLGGTAGFQSRYLADYFGDSPARDMGLVTSEGRHTIPLEDERPEGVPSIGAGFYEFVPHESSGNGGTEALEGHELSEGCDYRLVMTTAAGYFRFDIGDIVRCRGFRGEAPLLEFIQKSERTGDLEGEKLTEHQVIEGAHRAAGKLGINLGLITGVPCRIEHEQPHYEFLVEESELPERSLAERFLKQLDAELAELNFLWRARRNEGVIRAPRLHRLGENAWADYIRRETERRGTGDYQYKHPGIVQQQSWLEQFEPVDSITLE